MGNVNSAWGTTSASRSLPSLSATRRKAASMVDATRNLAERISSGSCAPTMEAAFRMVADSMGSNLDLLVVPHALLTLPIVQG